MEKNGKLNFRKFKKEDIRQIAEIKNTVFREFNSSEYFEKNAIENYLSFTDLKKKDEELLEEFGYDKGIFLVAEKDKKIVGYIKGGKGKIVNLFVIGKMHKQGIGRKLVELYEIEARKRDSCEIKINSSIHAISFYQKMGYKKSTGIRNMYGIKIQPMKKIL